ncbi:MAG: NAD(P)H-hydrate epimerase, partial [Anaerolineales bacterium]
MPFSQKLVSVEEMIAIEKAANASGLTYEKMMANAGRGLADVIQDRFGFLDEEGALGLIGSGNNGGDTLVALAHLAEEGWKADAYIVKAREKDDPLVERLVEAGGSVVQFADDRNFAQLDRLLDEAGLLLDGVFGTGIKLPLRGDAAPRGGRALPGRLLSSATRSSPECVARLRPRSAGCLSGPAL